MNNKSRKHFYYSAIFWMALFTIVSFCTVRSVKASDVLQLPDNLKIIEREAFANISASEIIFPEGIERIEPQAFDGCDMIQAFNQSSVLIQANETTTEFYSPDN